MKKATLRDVALAADTSTATVSRVLHGNGYVSPEARLRVQEALDRLQYSGKTSFDAGSLDAPTILFCVSSLMDNMLFSQIFEELGLRVQNKGLFLRPYFLKFQSPSDLPKVIESCRSRGLKAIVFCCTPESFDFTPLRKYLLNCSVPIIMIERAPNIFGLNKVMVNAREMIFQAVRHLYRKGHKRILYFAVDHHNNYDVEYERLLEFRESVKTMGLEESSDVFCIDEWSRECGEKGIQLYLSTHDTLPTAIISADSVLVGIAQHLHRVGLSVPKDISLMGLDNTYSNFISPPVSSVAFPISEICENVVRIIEEYQGPDSVPQSVLLSCKLVERQSVLSL